VHVLLFYIISNVYFYAWNVTFGSCIAQTASYRYSLHAMQYAIKIIVHVSFDCFIRLYPIETDWIWQKLTDFSPPLDFYINVLTINVSIIANGSLVCFPGVCFLGLCDVLECSVVFKWKWHDWAGIYPSENYHMIGQKAWTSNWLLFVIYRAQTCLKWDHLAAFNFYAW